MTAAMDTVGGLCAHEGRGAGHDGERRAALWLAGRLAAAGRPARIDTAWVAPEWPLVHALHAALVVAGSVVAAMSAPAGVAVEALAALSIAGDLSQRWRWARRLTPRRATQNVVCPSPHAVPARRVTLVVCARLDAGRAGGAAGPPWRGLWGRLDARLGGHLCHPLAVLELCALALLVVAGVRSAGETGTAVGAVALVPTLVALFTLAALVDLALAPASPGASEATAVAVALELVRTLDLARPRHLDVELVLTGAGQGPALGMDAYVRRERHRRPEEVVVLAVEPCPAGRPYWLVRDGQLAGLRLHPRLVALAAQVSARHPHLAAWARRGHGASDAYRARRSAWPAIAVGARDRDGASGDAHSDRDLAEAVSEGAMRATLELALALVAALDADLAHGEAPTGPGVALAAA